MRDYISDMRKAIDHATDQQPNGYLPSEVARELVERLREDDPDLLQGWLSVQTTYFLTRMINDRDRSIRASTRHQQRSGAYRDALQEHTEGDPTALYRFLDMPITDSTGKHRPLRSFYRNDLLTSAAGYRDREARNRVMALLLEGLAKRIGDQRVDEVYTEEQLAALFSGLKG